MVGPRLSDLLRTTSFPPPLSTFFLHVYLFIFFCLCVSFHRLLPPPSSPPSSSHRAKKFLLKSVDLGSIPLIDSFWLVDADCRSPPRRVFHWPGLLSVPFSHFSGCCCCFVFFGSKRNIAIEKEEASTTSAAAAAATTTTTTTTKNVSRFG